MDQPPKTVQVFDLPGVVDLPPEVKRHFGNALLAEMGGYPALAASELELAVRMEDLRVRDRVLDLGSWIDGGY